MAIRQIITRGIGPGGAPAQIVTAGLTPAAPPPTPTPTPNKKRRFRFGFGFGF